VIRDSTAATRPFAEMAVRVLASSAPSWDAMRDAVAAVRSLHARSPHDSLMVLVVPGLSEDDIRRLVPQAASSTAPDADAVFAALVAKVLGAQPPPIRPDELLIMLHAGGTANQDGQPDRAKQDRVTKAIVACLTHSQPGAAQRKTISEEAVAATLQRLVDSDPLPELLMFTVIMAYRMSSLANMINTRILPRLVERRVWLNQTLWEGVRVLCSQNQVVSAEVVLSLPLPQFKEMVNSGGKKGQAQDKVKHAQAWVSNLRNSRRRDIRPEIAQAMEEILPSKPQSGAKAAAAAAAAKATTATPARGGGGGGEN
jgi:hypothetical protein